MNLSGVVNEELGNGVEGVGGTNVGGLLVFSDVILIVFVVFVETEPKPNVRNRLRRSRSLLGSMGTRLTAQQTSN